MSAYLQLGRIEAGLPPALVDEDVVPTERVVFVRRVLSGTTGQVWQLLVSPAGSAVWLGPGALVGSKGEPFMTDTGIGGVVRSFHPLEQLRLSWETGSDHETSLVEIDLTPVAGGTRLRLWHEGLPPALRSPLQEQWAQRLDAFARICAGQDPAD